MKSTEYIICVLKCWEKEFPDIIVKYAFETDTKYHIITIQPHELYNNIDYIQAENILWTEFSKKYENENILISEPKHSLNLINIIYPILTNVSNKELENRRIKCYKQIL